MIFFQEIYQTRSSIATKHTCTKLLMLYLLLHASVSEFEPVFIEKKTAFSRRKYYYFRDVLTLCFRMQIRPSPATLFTTITRGTGKGYRQRARATCRRKNYFYQCTLLSDS